MIEKNSKEYEIHDVNISTDYKEGDIDLEWTASIGFGHLAFKIVGDKIHCNNETMGREFVKEVLNKLVDISIMDYERGETS